MLIINKLRKTAVQNSMIFVGAHSYGGGDCGSPGANCALKFLDRCVTRHTVSRVTQFCILSRSSPTNWEWFACKRWDDRCCPVEGSEVLRHVCFRVGAPPPARNWPKPSPGHTPTLFLWPQDRSTTRWLGPRCCSALFGMHCRGAKSGVKPQSPLEPQHASYTVSSAGLAPAGQLVPDPGPHVSHRISNQTTFQVCLPCHRSSGRRQQGPYWPAQLPPQIKSYVTICCIFQMLNVKSWKPCWKLVRLKDDWVVCKISPTFCLLGCTHV